MTDFERFGVTALNVVDISYTAEYLSALRFDQRVKAATLGGRSRVRSADRRAFLVADQWVGLLCNLAVCEFLAGTSAPWVYLRDRADAKPWEGDGGEDFPGVALDVKGSAMRGPADPLSYRLAVRPHERRSGWTYFLALAKENGPGGATVHIVGAAKDSDLPDDYERGGPFAGAFVLSARSLRPIDGARLSLRSKWECFKAVKGIK